MKDTQNHRAEVEIENLTLLGEGQTDPIFDHLTPDDTKAYVAFDICKAFPNVIGPEMGGSYFGFHPQVLANSFGNLLHKQVNLNHALKSYGATRDRIVGCTVAVSFPAPPDGEAWSLDMQAAEAPCLHVVAVLFKTSEGMPKMLGEHTSARRKWSTSIETEATMANTGVFRRSTGELYGPQNLPPEFAAAISREDGQVKLGQIDGEQLAWALGVEDGVVDFAGVAMTPTPAEKTAKITDLKAREEDPIIRVAATAQEPTLPVRLKQTVRWQRLLPGDPGRGLVEEIHVDGEHVVRGRGTVQATLAAPVVTVRARGRRAVKRTLQGLILN